MGSVGGDMEGQVGKLRWGKEGKTNFENFSAPPFQLFKQTRNEKVVIKCGIRREIKEEEEEMETKEGDGR